MPTIGRAGPFTLGTTARPEWLRLRVGDHYLMIPTDMLDQVGQMLITAKETEHDQP